MFTGLVRDVGTVGAVDARPDGRRLTVTTTLPGLSLGDSVAVNGVCLTVTEVAAGAFSADVVATTLALTSLGQLTPGARVNLEPALTLQDRLGGHLVTGHVDATGRVDRLEDSGDGRLLLVSAPDGVLSTCVERGSIAVDGVSLTIASLAAGAFGVALIPHTLAVTIAGSYTSGTVVNLESDLVGKYIARMAEPHLPARRHPEEVS